MYKTRRILIQISYTTRPNIFTIRYNLRYNFSSQKIASEKQDLLPSWKFSKPGTIAVWSPRIKLDLVHLQNVDVRATRSARHMQKIGASMGRESTGNDESPPPGATFNQNSRAPYRAPRLALVLTRNRQRVPFRTSEKRLRVLAAGQIELTNWLSAYRTPRLRQRSFMSSRRRGLETVRWMRIIPKAIWRQRRSIYSLSLSTPLRV